MIESVDPNDKGGKKKGDTPSSSTTPVLDNFSRDLIKLDLRVVQQRRQN